MLGDALDGLQAIQHIKRANDQSINRVVEGRTQMTTALLRTVVENLLQNGRKTLAERAAEAAHLIERKLMC